MMNEHLPTEMGTFPVIGKYAVTKQPCRDDKPLLCKVICFTWLSLNTKVAESTVQNIDKSSNFQGGICKFATNLQI